MALTSTEIDECRFESGYPATRIGAEPFIQYQAEFDVAIQPFVTDVGSTSTTLVAAVGDGGARVALTVASNPTIPQKPGGPAFIVNARVNVDVGPNQELEVPIEAVVPDGGTTIYVTLANAHGVGGIAYPVVLAGLEKIVRDILDRIRIVRQQLKDIAPLTAGVAKSDQGEVELFASIKRGRYQRSKYDELVAMRDDLRDELCQALNLRNMWAVRRQQHGGGSIEPY